MTGASFLLVLAVILIAVWYNQEYICNFLKPKKVDKDIGPPPPKPDYFLPLPDANPASGFKAQKKSPFISKYTKRHNNMPELREHLDGGATNPEAGIEDYENVLKQTLPLDLQKNHKKFCAERSKYMPSTAAVHTMQEADFNTTKYWGMGRRTAPDTSRSQNYSQSGQTQADADNGNWRYDFG